MESVEHLEQLAAALTAAGLVTQPKRGEPPRLAVCNPVADLLKEDILCAPDADGQLCFQWSWDRTIAAVDDIELAVERIAHVLKAVDG